MERREPETYDVIIIGGGPSGSSAALYTARAGRKTLVLDKGVTAGALGVADKISNYPGIPGPVPGIKVLRTIREQAEGFGARFVSEKVVGVDLNKPLKAVFTSRDTYQAKSVIVATGSMGRKMATPGEKDFLGHGVSYCATCDAAFYRGRTVAVIGNNEETLEELEILLRLSAKAYLICPTAELRVDPAKIARLQQEPKLEIRMNHSLERIEGKTDVTGITIRNRETKQQESLATEGVFIYLQGAQPVTDYLTGQLEPSSEGCLKVDGAFQTLVPGVFAIGDVICTRIRQAVVAAADGVIAAGAVEKYLRGSEKIQSDWGQK